MVPIRVLSFNCHGFNIGILKYLRQKCLEFDIILLQETWLSNGNSSKLDDISPDFTVLHTSAMEDRINVDYFSGRPFGGTAILYNKLLPCVISTVNTNTPRCTCMKMVLDGHRDVIVVSVYMPYLNGSAEQKIEYESTIGCLQGIVDSNIGCDFLFGGDFNVSKSNSNGITDIVANFCDVNAISWLDLVNNDVVYTYHAETNGHYSHIDHMLVSRALMRSQQSVKIHVDDHNASDHYAISVVVDIDSDKSVNDISGKRKTLKYMWNRGDTHEYANVLSNELSKIAFPKVAVNCNGVCQHENCTQMIDQYYRDIVQCLITASNSCIPIKNSRHEKHWWNDDLDDLKQQVIDATDLWRTVGCPRSGVINANRLQCKYRYKLAIKQAVMNADEEFNEELFSYFSAKEDEEFWRAWRKRYCSSSLKTTNTLNGKSGNVDICKEFTNEFSSVLKTNTVNADVTFKAELNEYLEKVNRDKSVQVDIDLVRDCLGKMKLKKSPGLDNVSVEHLVHAGSDLQVHLCLLFNSLLKHCYVPREFAHGLIIPLLKDRHGDQTRLDMYRGITLSPNIAKLFEYVLLECFGDELSSSELQFGFKKHSGCTHALFTFKQTTRYFIKNGSKVYCAFVDASKAFDKVLHNGLFVKLINKNVSVSFVRLLQSWYSKLHASVLWNGIIGATFLVHCGVRQGGVLSPLLFAIYVDDLLNDLRLSGYGTYIGSLFVGAIAYADDICLLSCSCHGLQKMLDICSAYSVKWDIRFNPDKSQLMTVGGSTPVDTVVYFGDKIVQWVSKVKYLGLYVTSGSEFKIDLTVAKRKYYGCFNTIKSTAGNKMNEIMLLHILKTYCLPRLLYGCEIWPLDTMSFHDINVIWNNAFRSVFNCCWRESVKPLQFYCYSLPLSYLVEERQLLFFKKLFTSDNSILRTLSTLAMVQNERLKLARKYDIVSLQGSTAYIKKVVWDNFCNCIVF